MDRPEAYLTPQVQEPVAVKIVAKNYRRKCSCCETCCESKTVAGMGRSASIRIGEDEPEDEDLLRDLWEDEAERETVLMGLQAECEVLAGRPEDYFPY